MEISAAARRTAFRFTAAKGADRGTVERVFYGIKRVEATWLGFGGRSNVTSWQIDDETGLEMQMCDLGGIPYVTIDRETGEFELSNIKR